MSRGGRRPNAGRPQGLGPYGESTKPMRIPISLISSVKQFIAQRGYALPLFVNKVQAGLPSPADDSQEDTLDLNTHLIKDPNTTFLVRAIGNSMLLAGIFPNDLLVVDKSLTPTDGKIVIARVKGEFTVKRLKKQGRKIWLVAENPDYTPMEMSEESEFEIWGVVTNVIHAV